MCSRKRIGVYNMLKTAKFSIIGVTAGKKYLVTPYKKDYYNVMLDNGQMAIRHRALFN